MRQADIVRTSEGDAWHARNSDKNRDGDPVVIEILDNPNINPLEVLEIGCGTGWRLQRLYERYRCAGSGLDLSWQAIETGRKRYSRIGLRVGEAAHLGYADDSFDLVIIGFCLYLVDREDLFKVVAETDRVLRDKGALIIHDFTADEPHSVKYAHDPRLKTFKMNHWNLWKANPAYTLESFKLLDGEGIVTLRKDIQKGWPLR